MKIYLGFSIAGASEAFRSDIEELIAVLDEVHEVLRFYKDGFERAHPGEAGEVWRFDIGQIDACDAFVAILSEPSTGLGYEIGYALQCGKPVLAVARQGETVSNMIAGIGHPNFSLVRVENFSEVPRLLEQYSR